MRKIKRNIKRSHSRRGVSFNISKALLTTGFALAMSLSTANSAWSAATDITSNNLPVANNINGATLQYDTNTVVTETGTNNVTDALNPNLQNWADNSNKLDITVQQSVAKINYNTYNVAAGKTVNYNFTTSGQVAINTVTKTGSAYASNILGNITQNGTSGSVFLINPNGMLFGPTSNVNLNSFTATTFTQNSDFDGTNLSLSRAAGTDPQGIYVSSGSNITGTYGVSLAANAIASVGNISAPNGNVQLVTGDGVNFVFTPVTTADSQTQLAQAAITKANITAANSDGLPENVELMGGGGTSSQAIAVRGGTIAGHGIQIGSAINAPVMPRELVNLSGVITANTLNNQGGELYVYAANTYSTVNPDAYCGCVSNNTTLTAASGTASNGKVTLDSNKITLTSKGKIKADDVTLKSTIDDMAINVGPTTVANAYNISNTILNKVSSYTDGKTVDITIGNGTASNVTGSINLSLNSTNPMNLIFDTSAAVDLDITSSVANSSLGVTKASSINVDTAAGNTLKLGKIFKSTGNVTLEADAFSAVNGANVDIDGTFTLTKVTNGTSFDNSELSLIFNSNSSFGNTITIGNTGYTGDIISNASGTELYFSGQDVDLHTTGAIELAGIHNANEISITDASKISLIGDIAALGNINTLGNATVPVPDSPPALYGITTNFYLQDTTAGLSIKGDVNVDTFWFDTADRPDFDGGSLTARSTTAPFIAGIHTTDNFSLDQDFYNNINASVKELYSEGTLSLGSNIIDNTNTVGYIGGKNIDVNGHTFTLTQDNSVIVLYDFDNMNVNQALVNGLNADVIALTSWGNMDVTDEVTVTDKTLELWTSSISNNLTSSTGSINITNTGSLAIYASGDTNLKIKGAGTTYIEEGKNVTLTDVGANGLNIGYINNVVENVNITSNNDLNIGVINTNNGSGNVTLTAGDNIITNTINSNGNISLTAGNNINAGNITTSTTDGTVVLTADNNITTSAISATGCDITLTADANSDSSSSITVNGAINGQDIVLNTDETLNLNANATSSTDHIEINATTTPFSIAQGLIDHLKTAYLKITNKDGISITSNTDAGAMDIDLYSDNFIANTNTLTTDGDIELHNMTSSTFALSDELLDTFLSSGLDVFADTGTMTISDNVSLNRSIGLHSGNGALDLDDYTISLGTGSLTLEASGAVSAKIGTVAGVSAKGSLITLIGTGDLNVTSLDTDGAIIVTAAGDLTTSNIDTEGTVSLLATNDLVSGTIEGTYINLSGNTINTDNITASNNVALDATASITAKNITTDANITLESGSLSFGELSADNVSLKTNTYILDNTASITATDTLSIERLDNSMMFIDQEGVLIKHIAAADKIALGSDTYSGEIRLYDITNGVDFKGADVFINTSGKVELNNIKNAGVFLVDHGPQGYDVGSEASDVTLSGTGIIAHNIFARNGIILDSDDSLTTQTGSLQKTDGIAMLSSDIFNLNGTVEADVAYFVEKGTEFELSNDLVSKLHVDDITVFATGANVTLADTISAGDINFELDVESLTYSNGSIQTTGDILYHDTFGPVEVNTAFLSALGSGKIRIYADADSINVGETVANGRDIYLCAMGDITSGTNVFGHGTGALGLEAGGNIQLIVKGTGTVSNEWGSSSLNLANMTTDETLTLGNIFSAGDVTISSLGTIVTTDAITGSDVSLSAADGFDIGAQINGTTISLTSGADMYLTNTDHHALNYIPVAMLNSTDLSFDNTGYTFSTFDPLGTVTDIVATGKDLHIKTGIYAPINRIIANSIEVIADTIGLTNAIVGPATSPITLTANNMRVMEDISIADKEYKLTANNLFDFAAGADLSTNLDITITAGTFDFTNGTLTSTGINGTISLTQTSGSFNFDPTKVTAKNIAVTALDNDLNLVSSRTGVDTNYTLTGNEIVLGANSINTSGNITVNDKKDDIILTDEFVDALTATKLEINANGAGADIIVSENITADGRSLALNANGYIDTRDAITPETLYTIATGAGTISLHAGGYIYAKVDTSATLDAGCTNVNLYSDNNLTLAPLTATGDVTLEADSLYLSSINAKNINLNATDAAGDLEFTSLTADGNVTAKGANMSIGSIVGNNVELYSDNFTVTGTITPGANSNVIISAFSPDTAAATANFDDVYNAINNTNGITKITLGDDTYNGDVNLEHAIDLVASTRINTTGDVTIGSIDGTTLYMLSTPEDYVLDVYSGNATTKTSSIMIRGYATELSNLELNIGTLDASGAVETWVYSDANCVGNAHIGSVTGSSFDFISPISSDFGRINLTGAATMVAAGDVVLNGDVNCSSLLLSNNNVYFALNGYGVISLGDYTINGDILASGQVEIDNIIGEQHSLSIGAVTLNGDITTSGGMRTNATTELTINGKIATTGMDSYVPEYGFVGYGGTKLTVNNTISSAYGVDFWESDTEITELGSVTTQGNIVFDNSIDVLINGTLTANGVDSNVIINSNSNVISNAAIHATGAVTIVSDKDIATEPTNDALIQLDGSINAGKDVSITANSGKITISEAITSGGSTTVQNLAAVTPENTDNINVEISAPITAGNDIALTTNAGMQVNGAITGTGAVVEGIGSLSDLTASANYIITGNNGIIDVTGNADLSARNIDLSASITADGFIKLNAGDTLLASALTAGDYIDIDAGNYAYLNQAVTGKSVDLNSAGHFDIYGNVTATDGDINISFAGIGLVDAGLNVINSANKISIQGPTQLNINTSSVTPNLTFSAGSVINAPMVEIATTASGATPAGSITLGSLNFGGADLILTSAAGNITSEAGTAIGNIDALTLNAGGAIALNTGVTNSIDVNSATSLKVAAGVNNINIIDLPDLIAGNVELSGNNITVGENINSGGKVDISSTTATLEDITAAQRIFITNTGGASTGDLSAGSSVYIGNVLPETLGLTVPTGSVTTGNIDAETVGVFGTTVAVGDITGLTQNSVLYATDSLSLANITSASDIELVLMAPTYIIADPSSINIGATGTVYISNGLDEALSVVDLVNNHIVTAGNLVLGDNGYSGDIDLDGIQLKRLTRVSTTDGDVNLTNLTGTSIITVDTLDYTTPLGQANSVRLSSSAGSMFNIGNVYSDGLISISSANNQLLNVMHLAAGGDVSITAGKNTAAILGQINAGGNIGICTGENTELDMFGGLIAGGNISLTSDKFGASVPIIANAETGIVTILPTTMTTNFDTSAFSALVNNIQQAKQIKIGKGGYRGNIVVDDLNLIGDSNIAFSTSADVTLNDIVRSGQIDVNNYDKAYNYFSEAKNVFISGNVQNLGTVYGALTLEIENDNDLAPIHINNLRSQNKIQVNSVGGLTLAQNGSIIANDDITLYSAGEMKLDGAITAYKTLNLWSNSNITQSATGYIQSNNAANIESTGDTSDIDKNVITLNGTNLFNNDVEIIGNNVLIGGSLYLRSTDGIMDIKSQNDILTTNNGYIKSKGLVDLYAGDDIIIGVTASTYDNIEVLHADYVEINIIDPVTIPTVNAPQSSDLISTNTLSKLENTSVLSTIKQSDETEAKTEPEIKINGIDELLKELFVNSDNLDSISLEDDNDGEKLSLK